METILKFILKLGVIFCCVFLTTIGWKFTKSISLELNEEQFEAKRNLRRIVSHLSEEIGNRNYKDYSNLNAAAEFIINEFKEMGYSVDTQMYDVEGVIFKNIIAEIPGDPSTPPLIIGAHYDSCFNPGADDNASGIAVMLELARLIKKENTNVPIKYVAFVNEEPPFFPGGLMGSEVYAKYLKTADVRIKGAIVLESVGYYSDKTFSQKYLPLLGPFFPNKGDFISIVGNFKSSDLTKSFFLRFKENSNFPVEKIVAPDFIPGINFSDHKSFWGQGYPAVMITDTAFLRNANYHKKTDLPDTLDYSRMTILLYGLKDAIVNVN